MLMALKEGASGVIDLREDEPNMVSNMLHFLYIPDYQDDYRGDRPLLVNASMYAIGDKYRIDDLKYLSRIKSRML